MNAEPEAPLAAPLAPATLDDLAVLDERLLAVLAALPAPRADVDGAALRALLQLSRTKVQALGALVRLANDRRGLAPGSGLLTLAPQTARRA